MSGFADLAAELVGKLTAAGLPATDDPAALPPFVLVDLFTVDRAVGLGAWGVSVPIKIVNTPPGNVVCRRWLEDSLQTVLTTLGYAPAIATTYRHGDRDCPAYSLTYPLEVPNPNC